MLSRAAGTRNRAGSWTQTGARCSFSMTRGVKPAGLERFRIKSPCARPQSFRDGPAASGLAQNESEIRRSVAARGPRASPTPGSPPSDAPGPQLPSPGPAAPQRPLPTERRIAHGVPGRH
ncbi:translation initiation factor IF-2-like [Moschus berezovskii]|uniref:translation initiation factor IF-2-like n=1 Tax=Moschus berezovskii TaxID=68408 RepID=UPI00244439CD|nr:translation initiation factor IF-2-like [Moschus berezovskii]